MRILITGGAGFVGSHTADALIKKGHHIVIFDNLETQVHGANAKIPTYLHKDVEFVFGDIRHRSALKSALKDIEAVYHLAAAVGVGQSMYEVHKYVEVNSLGGATLLDILVNDKTSVKKLIVASSMSIYGEGKYHCQNCGTVYPRLRADVQLASKNWEMQCPNCQRGVTPLATDETKPLYPTSIYAITKRDHEEMFLTVGRAYGIPTVALRYFNIYGSRQALSNPYTGVAAIFSSRLLNNKSPMIFEDGLQSRDFIHINDIVQANLLALEKPEANHQVFNVGTGRSLTILEMARILKNQIAPSQQLQVLEQFRSGDIRHCFANILKITNQLGYSPKIKFEDGIHELVQWVNTQQATDMVETAKSQLIERKLVR